ncbi:LysR family transcriptional regulator [Pseudomonas laurylsulfatiphila]|uniref:LysR family transcriptional regulator n=1 Tax=Pseudomonas laurylsulfatiphila TaxID=2011015 RepID=UPI003D1C0A18
MDFESIRIFLRVVERGSFTAAAAQLGMPVTSASRKVKALEHELGVQLLYRTTRRISVTEAGRGYYERCVRAEEILDDANRTTQALRTEPEGTLRVLMPYAVGLIVLEPALVEFRRRYPKVQLVLTYDDQPLDLIEHGFDTALRTGPLVDSQYASRSLGWSRARLVASPAYLDRVGRPASPQDLVNHDILVVGGDGPSSTLRLKNDVGEVAELTVKPVLISNESVTIIRQAVNGGGIALISTQFTAHRVSAGELEIVLPRWNRADDAQLYALFPQHATLDRKVRAFVDFAIEVFSTWQINPEGAA